MAEAPQTIEQETVPEMRNSIVRFVCFIASLVAAYVCQARDASRTVDLDLVWTGTRVRFDAIEAGGFVYVAYYDSDRWLTLARVALADGAVQKVRLDSRFAGWDSHNYVSLAFDGQQRLHVSGNMHASQLVYFRSDQPLSINAVAAPMAGRDEKQVSYPTFLHAANGDLLFFYRSGISGQGDWLINRWNGQSWDRIGGPVFTKQSSFGHVSAYPSRFVRDSGGTYHVAIIWRKTINVESNFRVSYARTKDFVHWTDSNGKPIAAPVSPETGEMVDDTGENAGLLNNPQIALDPAGSPVISYTKYGAGGTNGIIVASRKDNAWVVREVAHSPTLTKLEGRGTLPEAPSVEPVAFRTSGEVAISFSFPGSHHFVLNLDPASLVPLGAPTAEVQRAPAPKAATHGAPKLIEQVVPVRHADGSSASPVGQLVWSAQGANRDLPPCTEERPTVCAPPPATLKLVIFTPTH